MPMKPEPPDFEQLARQLAETVLYRPLPEIRLTQVERMARAQVTVAEQLRQVWNARGAADRLAVVDLLIAQPENVSAPVQYAIKKLDR